MDAMSTLSSSPRRPGLTRGALEHTPDDGYRYELIDGTLLVTPAPGYRHQRIVVLLARLLDDACPPDLVTLVAPFAVGLAVDTEVQPDVLVAPRHAVTEKDLPGAPLLAVEVLSSSTRQTDLELKWQRYERAGVTTYWIIDPYGDADGPTLVALDLVDGAYVTTAELGPTDTWEATTPFAVTLSPGNLID